MHPDWVKDAVTVFTFSAPADGGAGITHDVYAKGDGPPILILQELPGIDDKTFALADRLIDAGFKIYLPHMLGRFGTKTTLRNMARLLCIRREFDAFLSGAQSPVAGWMRALCAEIAIREGGAQIGVIGMCLTGSFAIPLMAEDAVIAAVASQPSLPMLFNSDKLHMSDEDVTRACGAMARKGPAIAMRFKSDTTSKPAHIAALKAAFGMHLEVTEYDNPPGHKGKAHSLLTGHFKIDAYERTESYFKARFGMR